MNQPEQPPMQHERVITAHAFVEAVTTARAEVLAALACPELTGTVVGACLSVAVTTLIAIQSVIKNAEMIAEVRSSAADEPTTWAVARGLEALIVLELAATLVIPAGRSTAYCAPLERARVALRPIYSGPKDLPS